MRKDVKIIKVYRFEELSEEAQRKALEISCDINVDYPWWDCVYEDAKNIGVKIEEFELDRGNYCRGQFMLDEWDVAENILKEHGKDCETYKDATDFLWFLALAENKYRNKVREHEEGTGEDFVPADLDDFDASYECPELLSDFQEAIFEDYRSLLQKEYNYLTSREAIRDTLDVNEYEFTEDGRIYY